MKSLRLWIICFGITSIFACKSSQTIKQPASAIVDITILQINDVYEIGSVEKGLYGGLARVATLRKNLLKDNPNVYTVLAGDFLSPSLLGTLKYEGQRIKGKQMVETLNSLGLDLVTFGNHEFDLKENELQDRMNESTFDWISANVLHKTMRTAKPFAKMIGEYDYPFQEYMIKEYSNDIGAMVRVGFLAVTVPFTKKDWIIYHDPVGRAADVYNFLKDTCDIVIPITHLNLADDKKLAKQIPDVPLIIGGHEHTNMYVPVGNVKIAKADANARTAYVHHFSYDTRMDTFSFSSELVSIDTSITEDPTVKAIVDKWELIQDKLFAKEGFDKDEVLLHIDGMADGREKSIRYGQTNLGMMITRAMMYACPQTDCAVLNSGSIRIDDQLTGDITQYDILRTLPFGGSIVEVDMKGALLEKILEIGEMNAGIGGYLQRAQAKPNQYKEGQWLLNNKPLDQTAVYRVAISDFLLTGMETNFAFLTRDNPGIIKIYEPDINDPKDLTSDIRKAVIAYLRSL